MLHALLNILQEVIEPSGLFQTLIYALLSVLLPAAAVWLAMQAAKLIPIINAMGDFEKRLLVAIFGVAIAQVNSVLGLNLPAWLDGFDASAWKGLLDAAVAMVWYKIFKRPSAPAAAKR